MRTSAGERYSKSAYKNLRAGMQRHLQSPPHNKLFDIIKDRIFKPANIVFEGYMVKIREEGKDHTQSRPSIDRDDAKRLYAKVFTDTPTGLQHHLFYELCMHFGRRGREGLRLLRKDSFQLKKDARGLYSMINELYSAPLPTLVAQPCLPFVPTTFGAIR